MHKLKTGDSFEEGGYTVTRLGASGKESKSDWALLSITKDGSSDIRVWVKKGHCFSIGDKVCKLEDSNREESCLAPGEASETGIAN